jgi:hypothetical protein
MLDQCCNPLADLLIMFQPKMLPFWMELAEPKNGLGFRRMVFHQIQTMDSMDAYHGVSPFRV